MLPISDDNETKRFPVVTLVLILANVAVFFAWQMQVGMVRSVEMGALVPTELHPLSFTGVKHLFMAMFMHGDILHLLGNMWFLWIFGDNVEDEIGRFSFVVLYILCGVAGAAAHVALNLKSTIPMVGASAAISGALGAYLVLHPKARLRMFFGIRSFRIPAWLYLVVWIAFQTLALTETREPGMPHIAHAAHIGGFFAGMFMSTIVTPRMNPRTF